MKTYNKLVRDEIPKIIGKNGESCKYRILTGEEFKKELLKKVVEEANEVLETNGDEKELTKELGDLFEIADYLIEAYKLDRSEIEKMRQERKVSRGGFDKKIFLESTE